jgi:hypothetical protein
VTRLCLLVALALPLTGCAGRGFGSAMQAFDEARYADAIADFRAVEPELVGASPRALARYALYRGLTHLALGDARAASYWLEFAKRRTEREPHLLSDDDRGRLESAWRSMGKMPGE